jgi:hypothetical protein
MSETIIQKNVFMANIIYYFHLFIIFCVLVLPFTNIPAYLILHIVGSISLLLHWKTNSNICSLTLLEAQLRGIDRVNTFTHDFIAPIYDISNTDWSEICTLITLILLFVSIIKLANNEKAKQMWKACKQISNTQYDSFLTKMSEYMKCFAIHLN